MTARAKLRAIAEQTPESRNRSADFYRALSIMFVVSGHWFLAAPFMDADGLVIRNMLAEAPWTQFATWVFQVMPVFFLVGGYSNAASWDSASRDPVRRSQWASGRLSRLLAPTVPLVLVWACIGMIAVATGVPEDLIRQGSQVALVPTWFLAVYIMVTLVVPVSRAFWKRAGLWSVAALVVGAIIVDLLAFGAGLGWLRWANYGFVWLAMHQLGYWWRDDAPGAKIALALLALGVIWLALLIGLFGYPVSMVSVPGQEVSNTRPPTVAMLAIGFAQAGLILALEPVVSRLMHRVRPWMGVIAVSRVIMTVYLWHSTALLLLVGVLVLAGGAFLHLVPGSAVWWIGRIPWFVALVILLAGFVTVFGRFEASSRTKSHAAPGPVQTLVGAILACTGLVRITLFGIGAPNLLGIDYLAVGFVLAGVFFASKRFGNHSKK